MINNFEQITKMLSFDNDDEFYFVQILQRKKDNPNNAHGSNNSSRLIKAYYISSVDKLMKYRDEMIFFANYFNARVGINLNKRSYEKSAFNMLKKVAEQMHNKNYKSTRDAFNSVCGIHNGGDKIWILDVDTKAQDYIASIKLFVNCQPPFGTVIDTIPSKSGIHIITKGFDLRNFSIQYPEIEVHKNNPTNLYIP